MPLETYREKRDFSRTPEPVGDKATPAASLRFVIQEHHASTLHYDFRLEMGGVLKSWAVPKGPSNDPAEKRLAVQVEDHPVAYRTFEGEIPEGSYGAGTVKIWDAGTYEAEETNGRGEDEKKLLGELEAGSLKFVLHGKKLQGAFALIRMKNGGADAWLLIKQRDQYAATTDEKASQPETPEATAPPPVKPGQAHSRADAEPEPKAASKPEGGTVINIEGHSLALSNLDKVYWPATKYTKGDLVAYYRRVAEWMLPYLKDRPQSLHRHPNGIRDEGFYQRDIRNQLPEWVETVEVYSESTKRSLAHVLCQDEATLVYLNNLGCIEIHPWNARAGSLDKPDYLVIDLDPGENTYDQVVQVALAVKEVMDGVGATAFCKTSGATGMHIFVPLAGQYGFGEAEAFARRVAELVHAQLPQLTSLERSPKARRNQVYLDYLQNNIGQSVAAAYRVRPKPGATVSTPLHWDEVKKGLQPAAFTIRTVPDRLDRLGDIFSGVLEAAVDLKACMARLPASG
jgi:bifunctional non-homologous end joining protein LigD